MPFLAWAEEPGRDGGCPRAGLALAFGSELINPWLPELVSGCRSLPGSPDSAGIAQR